MYVFSFFVLVAKTLTIGQISRLVLVSPARTYAINFNPFMLNGISPCYQLDWPIFNFRVAVRYFFNF